MASGGRTATGGVVRMRGLPFSACASDVVSFFRNVPTIDKERVYFAYDSTGRPSGEAYVVFVTTDGFNAAMRMHKQKMGPRYIEMFSSSGSELQRVAKQRKLRVDKGQGRSRMLVSPKDVDVKLIAAPRVSSIRGDATGLQRTLHTAVPSQDAKIARPRPRLHTFASVAAASPPTSANPQAASLSSAIDIQSHASSSVQQQDSGVLALASQGQLSAAGSGTSSAWTAAGQRGLQAGTEKQADYSMDHSSDSSSWQHWGAEMGLYNMWATHDILPKMDFMDSPEKAPFPTATASSWEPQTQSRGFYAAGT